LEEFEGLILKRIDYKESSKIIYLYTAKGLKSVLVHGANKLNSPYLGMTETLSLVKVFCQGKNLKVLKDASLILQYSLIKNDLNKYTYVMHLFELIYHFSENEFDHEKLYMFLLKILILIETTPDYIPYIYMFESKLLYLLGVNPLFKQCVVCGKKENLFFSIKEGGMCCQEHFHEPLRFKEEVLLLFQTLYYFDLQTSELPFIEEPLLKELRHLLDLYYDYHLNFQTKSRTVLKGLIGY